jgi:hypothetical protein
VTSLFENLRKTLSLKQKKPLTFDYLTNDLEFLNFKLYLTHGEVETHVPCAKHEKLYRLTKIIAVIPLYVYDPVKKEVNIDVNVDDNVVLPNYFEK